MKIKNLTFRHITSFLEEQAKLDKINIFMGLNAAGKTTIKDSLSKLLIGTSGKSMITNEERNLLTYGKKSADITAEIDDLTLNRHLTNAAQTLTVKDKDGNWEDTTKELEAKFLQRYGASRQVVEAVINTSRFLFLKPKEQGDLLLKLLNVKINPEDLKNYLSSTANLPKEITPAIMDELYKKNYEERKNLRRQIKSLEPQIIDIPEEEGSLEELQTKLTELQNQQSKLIEQKGAHNQTFEIQKQLKNKKIELGKDLPNKDTTNIDKQIKQKQDEIASYAAETEKLTTSHHKTDIDLLNAKITLIEKSPDNCAICDNELSMDQLEQIYSEQQKHSKIIDQIKDKEFHKNAAAKELDRLRTKKLDSTHDTTDNELASIDNQLKNLKIPTKKAIRETEEKLQTLTSEIEKINDRVQTLKTAQKQRDEQKELRKELEKAKKELKHTEELVNVFQPGEIRNKILKDHINPLQTEANEMLKALTKNKYSLQFDFSKDFRIQLSKDDLQLAIADLSDSEVMRLGVIFQCVLGMLSKLKFLTIDRLESLDIPQRKSLLQFLLNNTDRFDTVMMFQVPTLQVKNPDIPGVNFYWVDDGHIREVEK